MPIETVFPQIIQRLRQLRDAVSALRLTVVEDKPRHGDSALIDLRSDAIDELIGRIDEAIESAARGNKAVRPPQRHEVARQAMARCHATFNALARRFRSDLVSYERIAELLGLARERGREWNAWAASVRGALRQCEQPLEEMEDALLLGWREIAARAGPSVSVHSSSIGQKVTMPAPQSPVD